MIALPSDKRAEAIARRFTPYSVVSRAAEECVEAGNALLHYRRALEGEGNTSKCLASVTEELADVLVMCAQLRYWDPSLNDEVVAAAEKKMRRTGRRYGISIPKVPDEQGGEE